MKTLFSFIIYLISVFPCVAQKSKIESGEALPIAGKQNIFYYVPGENLILPAKMDALIVYKRNNEFYKKTVPLIQKSRQYEFVVDIQDSVSLLIVAIVDNHKEIMQTESLTKPARLLVDNNAQQGFIIPLYDKSKKLFPSLTIDKAVLLSGYAKYALSLKSISDIDLIKLYEKGYALYPNLKKKNSYINYLVLLNKVKPEIAQRTLFRYEKQLESGIVSEQKLMELRKIFDILKMKNARDSIEKIILDLYPAGLKAEEFFWEKFYVEKDKDEESILKSLNRYIDQFKDSSALIKDKFYFAIIQDLLTKRRWDLLNFYENILSNKLPLSYAYNSWARNIVKKNEDTTSIDLLEAKSILERSLCFIKSLSKDSALAYNEDLQNVQNMITDSYALSLYHLHQFDSAFFYQDNLYNQKNALDTGGIGRYAKYAEKVKGLEYTKNLIENLVLKGVTSETMYRQLTSIYVQLGISPRAYANLQEQHKALIANKVKIELGRMYDSLKAVGFSLENLKGEKVTLSSLKDKIVVLDFWATWCGPCRASFPAMKRLLDKYRTQSDVVFLFIDTWENTDLTKLKREVNNILEIDKYDFNVLFDYKNKMVEDYNVKGLPTKIIINKKGEIVYVESDLSGGTKMMEAIINQNIR